MKNRGSVLRVRLATTMLLLGALASRAAAATPNVGEPGLRIVGTDLLGVGFVEAVYRATAAAHLKVALALDGSRPGLDQLRANRADLALIVLPPDETRALDGFETVPIGFHRVVVLAPANAALDAITIDQLARLFGGDNGAPAVRWAELGVHGELAAKPIAPVAPEVGVGIAVEYFRRAVLHDGALKLNVQRYRTPAELAFHFTGQARALALAAAPLPDGHAARIVAVAKDAGAPAVKPTPENLADGRYPLQLALQLVFRSERRAALAPMVAYLLGNEASSLLESAGVVPLTPRRRAETLAMLTRK